MRRRHHSTKFRLAIVRHLLIGEIFLFRVMKTQVNSRRVAQYELDTLLFQYPNSFNVDFQAAFPSSVSIAQR